jgi:hypothetical protein
MNRFRRFLFAGLALAALGGGAAAQSYKAFQDEWNQVQKARFHFGPIRIFPTLSLQHVGYDNNVYFESQARGDYTGTIVPAAKIYWPLTNWLLLSASDAPAYTYYLHEKNRREFGNSYSGGGKALLFGRFVLSGSAFYEKNHRQLSSEIGNLVTDTTRGYDAGLAYETARKTSLSVRAFQSDIAIEENQSAAGGMSLAPAFNRREKGLTLELNYPLFSESFFFLSFNSTVYSFVGAASNWRNSRAASIAGGLRFPLNGSLSGTLALGYKKFTLASGPYPGFSGLTANTELDGRFGLIGVRLRYSRDNPFSLYQDVVYFVEDGYGGGVSLYLTAFLRLDYNYDSSVGDYPEFFTLNAETGENEAVRRRDRHHTNSLGLVFRIFASTGFGLTWNETRWTSTLPGWDRERRFVGAYLTQRF